MSRKSKAHRQKVSMLTLGCSKNLVDSETILGRLRPLGFEFTDDAADCDVMIINTCGFIKPAKEESIKVILEAGAARSQGRLKKLIVTGCLAERYKEDLKGQIDGVDHYLGINSADEIASLLAADYKRELSGERMLLTPSHYAYIKISDGCDNPCSFCAIPVIRGKYTSRSEEEILREARSLAAGGSREIIVIAQDTTYYGLDLYGKRTLASLLDKLSDIPGIDWLRLMYAYPTRFPEDILDVIASKPNICKYVDIPLQHISDRILKSMRRGTTSKQVKSLLEKIRSKVPGVAIRSAFICGYPGETDEEFRELHEFVRDYELDRVGVFAYSHEEGTAAYELEDNIPDELKQERIGLLMEAQMKVSLRKNEEKIGSVIKVLVDSKHKEGFSGRSEFDAPEIDNGVILKTGKKLKPGDMVDARVVKALEYDLIAEL